MSEDDKDRNWRQLEEKAEGALEERDAWMDVALRGLVKDAGYDPDKGVTEVVLDKFKESADISPSSLRPDDFKDFATELGFSPQGANEEGSGSEGEGNPNADEVEKATERADGLSGLGETDDGEVNHIEDANKKLLDGDVMGSINSKVGFLDENF